MEKPVLEAEQEVDFGRYVRAVAERWWLVVVGVVAGVVVGYLTTTGGSRPYVAETTVYLGQAFAAGGTNPLQNLPAKISTSNQFVTSSAVIRPIAEKIGVRPARLRAATTSRALMSVIQGKVAQATPLLEITVEGLPAGKAVTAARALANALVTNLSAYVDVKLGHYQARLERSVRELAQVNEKIARAEAQLQQVLTNRDIPNVERFLIQGNLNNVLQFNETRQNNLEGTQLTLRELVAQARQVERAKVVEPARATRSTGPARSGALAVGGVIGFLLGIVAALLWEPVMSRRHPQAS